MRSVSVAEAKAKLSELLDDVAARGETLVITRRGKPMVRVLPMEKTLEPVDVEALRAHLARFTSPPMSTEESLRLWRDDED